MEVLCPYGDGNLNDCGEEAGPHGRYDRRSDKVKGRRRLRVEYREKEVFQKDR